MPWKLPVKITFSAALAEDLFETLRARMAHWQRYRREMERLRKKQQVPDHTVSVQYTHTENNSSINLP
jgi:hypothetical protein